MNKPCEFEGCDKILTSRFNTFRGEIYCDDHIGKVSAPGTISYSAKSTGCTRCRAKIERGVESVFAVRAEGEPNIDVVLCTNCTALWAEGSSRAAYVFMQTFLDVTSTETVAPEPEPVHEPVPDPSATLPPRPGGETSPVE